MRRGLGENTFNPLKVPDLRANVGKMNFRPHLHLGAGLSPPIDKPEEATNFFDREAKLTRAQDETEA